MSTIQFERPPTFDVKIVGGKKIVIWNKSQAKSDPKLSDLAKPSGGSTSTPKPTKAQSPDPAPSGLSNERLAPANTSTASTAPDQKTDGWKSSSSTELKLNDVTGNEVRNKIETHETGDTNHAFTSTNINEKDTNDNLPLINSEENSPMKRRSASPPSLSSSFKVLPPIKKELEVVKDFGVLHFNKQIFSFPGGPSSGDV